MPRRPREWAFLALALLVAAGCIRLGFWQLDRLRERRARNAEIQARLALPAADLAQVPSGLENLAYRRVVARGRFDVERQVLVSPRPRDEQPGAHVITPLLLAGSEAAILVDRGWIPAEMAADGATGEFPVPGEVEVRGILRPAEPEPAWSWLADPTPAPGGPRRDVWRVLTIEGVQQQTPYPLAGYYVLQTEPLPGVALPVPDPALDLSQGPHLGYAIQWFSFAVIAVGGSLVWVRRQRRA